MSMNRKMWPLLAALTVSLAVPATAQKIDRDVPPGGLARNDAECIAQFQRADQNGDGVLSSLEMREAHALLPTNLSNGERVSRQEFLSACHAGFEGNQGAG
jgi:hypothetical protein